MANQHQQSDRHLINLHWKFQQALDGLRKLAHELNAVLRGKLQGFPASKGSMFP